MKIAKALVPVLALLALGFALAGCPKSDKMMGLQERPAAPSTLIG